MLALRRKGFNINHKTALRLTKLLGLTSKVRLKKYKSYKGEIGKIAANEIERNFNADKPNQKWTTDVTEVKIKEKKIYLSPILDMFNSEIISYSISYSPNFNMIKDMLNIAFEKQNNLDGLILHSDQGWHYQLQQYQNMLSDKRIIQSMSRKGNCLDNSIMENFFAIMKTELLYIEEFNSIEEFIIDLEKYIVYYNTIRIKTKLKGMSPIEYRIHSSKIA